MYIFYLMDKQPSRSTLFPYTTLFRSLGNTPRIAFSGPGLFNLDSSVFRRFAMKERVELEFQGDRKSTRLNSSHVEISYAVFCLKKKQCLQTTQRYIS